MLVQFPHGDTAYNDSLTLEQGKISIDLEGKNVRVHDGVTAGGHPTSMGATQEE